MGETRRNIAVGIFMVAGLAVLGLLMILFGEQPDWLGGAEYELVMDFGELRGVSEGMEIRLNGVQVGRVDRLEFTDPERPDRGVQVVGLIKDTYFIPRDAEAVVYPALLGVGLGRIVIHVLAAETEPQPKESARLPGKIGNPFENLVPETLMFSLDKAVQQIGNLAEAATPVAEDLHDLFDKRTVAEVDDPIAQAQRITANIYTVVERFDHLLRHFNDVFGDPDIKSALREAIENVPQISEDLRVAMANLRETSEHVRTDWDRFADRVDGGLADANAGINEIRERVIPALDSLAELADNLNRVSRDLAEGEGTAGLFVRDARLYEALLLSVQRLTDAVDTIRRIAERFEEQGYIEFKAHEAVGPLPVRGKKEIPE